MNGYAVLTQESNLFRFDSEGPSPCDCESLFLESLEIASQNKQKGIDSKTQICQNATKLTCLCSIFFVSLNREKFQAQCRFQNNSELICESKNDA